MNIAAEVLLYGAIGLMAGSPHAHFTGSQRAISVLHYLAVGVHLLLAIVVIAEKVVSLNG